MSVTMILLRRNIKLFFKDKGMFFTALITPAILLVLYATFLGDVYRDSVIMSLPESVKLTDRLLDGFVAGQLLSSLLSVSCVTVAFSTNFLMVQDRANGVIKDFRISPIKPSSLSLCYYAAALITSLMICFSALSIGLVYVASVGWFLSAADVVLLILDVILLVLFGTALSSVINFFLTTQGQISAIGSIVSSGYGFICGAYMPISSFSGGLQKVIMFLPGTYGTSLMRTHALQGAMREMQKQGVSEQAMDALKDALDYNLYFYDRQVANSTKYLVLCGFVAALIAVYILMNSLKRKKND